jgi:hypothetical protein
MSVTFTRSTRTHTRSTDTYTTATSTIVGEAIKVRGNPDRYKELGLVESRAPTLLFVPTTYGDRIEPGDTVEWNSTTHTARSCDHLEPDGVVIQTRVIVER